MTKEEFQKIIEDAKNLSEVPNQTLIRHMDELTKDFETIKSLSGIIFVSDWQELSFINHFKLSNIDLSQMSTLLPALPFITTGILEPSAVSL